ncbi:MAG: hypothetical protein HZB42_14480 [Sphingobacteriales bacterium]|nr:hypothetical protein [Sphingobacteriales bacterium]
MTQNHSQSSFLPMSRSLMFWKIFQVICWLAGIALLLVMFVNPSTGVMIFWNILIPVAPALLVIGTGVWRNVCPLGTTALLPDRLGFSKKIKLSSKMQAVLHLIAVLLLLLIIPLRHVLFNQDGQATALIILGLGVMAMFTGFMFERKSGWCSGLCPVHPVEKLYGSGVAFSLPNAHCSECVRCSVPCPDSTQVSKPFLSQNNAVTKATELVLLGCFPGYVWGWFHTPDYTGAEGWSRLNIVYGYPLLGAAASLLIYFLLNWFFKKHNKVIIGVFATAAVSCYYWFRLPILFGFGKLETHGMLVDLSNTIPGWSITAFTSLTTLFFFWWMVIRKKERISWSVRPRYVRGSGLIS